MNAPAKAVQVGLAVAGVVVAACGGGTTKTPAGRVRVVNLVSLDGGAGATLDVYSSGDNVFGSNEQPANATPLISNLAFGQASDHVTVFERSGNQGELSYYLAGKKDAASCVYGCTPPSGSKTGDQQTVLVITSKDSSDKLSAAFLTVYEHGATELPKPATGKAMMIGLSGATDWLFNFVEFSAGGTCLPAIADSSAVNGGRGYEVDAGTMQLTVHSTATVDCSGTTRVGGPAAFTLNANEMRLAIPYGTSSTDVSVLSLPVP